MVKRIRKKGSKFMRFQYHIIYFIYLFISFVSCQYLNPVTKQVASKKETVSVKKVWIRETFLKDFKRPSVLQSISPVLSSSDLLVQGNKVDGLNVYTMDRGKKKWFFAVEGGISGGVLIADGLIFFGGGDGYIYSLYLKTGQLLWKQHVGLTHISRPVVYKNYLYFASSNKIYCLNKKTGENVWTYSTQVKTSEFTVEGIAEPLVSESLVYFKVSDGSLIALNLQGKLKWKKEFPHSGRFVSASSPPIIGKMCLYSADLESGIYCLNKKNGKVIWKVPVGSHGHILLSDSHLFYPTSDGRIIALDQKSGKQIWDYKLHESISTSLVLYKDILIYGDYSGDLRFISRRDGKELGFFPVGSGLSASPVVSYNAKPSIYFISNSGWLYKLHLKNQSL